MLIYDKDHAKMLLQNNVQEYVKYVDSFVASVEKRMQHNKEVLNVLIPAPILDCRPRIHSCEHKKSHRLTPTVSRCIKCNGVYHDFSKEDSNEQSSK